MRLLKLLVIGFGVVVTQELNEPACYSRWDYEYKTMKQLLKTETDLQELTALFKKQQGTIESLSKSVDSLTNTGTHFSAYVRWGRTGCLGDAQVVYKGYIAGKHYKQHGGGADNVCLPEDPSWLNYTDGNDAFPRGYLYGTEIDVNEPSNIFPYRVWEEDVPCVLCTAKASAILMIPGRSDCYVGWKTEYKGYLMSSHHGHHGGHNHICVDYEPEFVPNGNKNNNEHILYLVEAQCGSLPCPPYVQGRELACVVCSK